MPDMKGILSKLKELLSRLGIGKRITKRSAAVTAIVFAVVILIAALTLTLLLKDDAPVSESAETTSDRLNGAMKITVSEGGREHVVYTKDGSVAEVLNMLGIKPDSDDEVSPALNETVGDGGIIEVSYIDHKTARREEVIPYTTIINEVQTVPRGTDVTVFEGTEGRLIKTVRQTLRNGEVIEEEVLDSVTVSAPQACVIERGIGGTIEGKDGVEYSFSYYIDVVATAYAAKGVTVTGKKATNGIIAVDPTVIPLGSKVYVKGDYADMGVCWAEDTGGFISGYRIDICLNYTYNQLLAFGRRDMRVYFLEDEAT